MRNLVYQKKPTKNKVKIKLQTGRKYYNILKSQMITIQNM